MKRMASRIPHDTHPPSPLPSLTPPPPPRTPPTQLLGRTLANPPPAPRGVLFRRHLLVVGDGWKGAGRTGARTRAPRRCRVCWSCRRPRRPRIRARLLLLLRRAFARGVGARVDDAPHRGEFATFLVLLEPAGTDALDDAPDIVARVRRSGAARARRFTHAIGRSGDRDGPVGKVGKSAFLRD